MFHTWFLHHFTLPNLSTLRGPTFEPFSPYDSLLSIQLSLAVVNHGSVTVRDVEVRIFHDATWSLAALTDTGWTVLSRPILGDYGETVGAVFRIDQIHPGSGQPLHPGVFFLAPKMPAYPEQGMTGLPQPDESFEVELTSSVVAADLPRTRDRLRMAIVFGDSEYITNQPDTFASPREPVISPPFPSDSTELLWEPGSTYTLLILPDGAVVR